ncbi:alpha-tocopherol transfer protein-like isoform X1 [Periplaneta americana]|uniref:alpha-tocopherol transfer protein-like isoform X1 n=1 Tax=Periplaneta americana TaxID=6978 RepID=UPI0037E963A7
MATHYFKPGSFQAPKGREADVKHLRDWLKGQPHLPAVSDEHLYLFLNSCDYQLTKCKETMENYYTIRTHSPDIFCKRDPSSPLIQVVLNICNMVPINWTSPEGYKVVLFRLVDFDASKFHFVEALKMMFMFLDMYLAEDGLRPGYIAVFDMKGATLGHLARASISAVKTFMNYIQDCQPAALKAVHIINTVSFIDKVMLLVKPFLKSELKQLLHFHGPPEEIAKFIPLEILPEECGGKTESAGTAHAKVKALMTEYSAWFQEEEELKVDESKRQGKKHPFSETMGGAEGSFRKLDID